MPEEVKKIIIQVRAPIGRDPGNIEEGWYCVADGFVTLTDEHGKPVSGAPKRHLDPNGDARLIACALLRQHRRGRTAVSKSFNRPLQYGRD
jgi:hypothetical protein